MTLATHVDRLYEVAPFENLSGDSLDAWLDDNDLNPILGAQTRAIQT